jgi:hypothetical protein
MGLADRDYMRERREKREDFQAWDSPEKSASTTLWCILATLAMAYGGYKAWNWWAASHLPRAAVAAPAASSGRSPATLPKLTGDWDGNRPLIPATSRATAAPGTVVIKCVANGAISYVASEADCAAQAKAIIVRIDPKQNLSDGLPNAEQIIRQPSPHAQIDVAPAGLDPNIQRQALCQAYEQEIKSIDTRARQPLSGQEQDWLAAKRKKARDEQFRLRC